jgi:SAM-dependent methyltransferase
MTNIDAHNQEIKENIANWKHKPLLREIYRGFHETIAGHLADRSLGAVVELGSGVADITEVIPNCVRTDLFLNPWIDHVENAYDLSFDDESVSTLILFDVFHHLRYPGTALREFHRVLASHGRVLIFEPSVSVLGWIVYGLLHREPLGLAEQIQWDAPAGWSPTDLDYYAAQGNATRIFLRREIDVRSFGWKVIMAKRLCSISYVASGGYSKPQMYPSWALPIMLRIDSVLSYMPQVFGTRLLTVMDKTNDAEPSAGGDA